MRFFDVAKFPTLTLQEHFLQTDRRGKNYAVTGDLTFHGVTKSVTLNAAYNGTVANPMSKKATAGQNHRYDQAVRFQRRRFFPRSHVERRGLLDANTEFTQARYYDYEQSNRILSVGLLVLGMSAFRRRGVETGIFPLRAARSNFLPPATWVGFQGPERYDHFDETNLATASFNVSVQVAT